MDNGDVVVVAGGGVGCCDGDNDGNNNNNYDNPQTPRSRAQRTIVSNTRKTYAILPSASRNLLSTANLRAVDRYIALNGGHRHTDRSCAPADIIPPLPFARCARAGSDEVLSLSAAAVAKCESALDVPLRFAAPEEFGAPALEEPPSRMPLARRIAALLKGRESVPMHWAAPSRGAHNFNAHTHTTTTNTMGDDHRNNYNKNKNHHHHGGGGGGNVPSISFFSSPSSGGAGGLFLFEPDDGVTRLRVIADAVHRAQSAMRAGETLKAARLHCTAAALHYNSGNMRRAQQSYAHALAGFEAVGDARGVAFCHNVLGVCHHRLHEFKVALVHHRKQESLGGCYARAVAQINMGVSYAALGELRFAEQALEDALTSARTCEDEMLETIALGNQGLVYMRMGNMRAAQTSLEQCLEKCSLTGDKSGASICLLLLGELYSLIQDLKHALFYYEHAFRVGGEAQCADVVNVARVSIGITRGNAALQQAVMQQAERMGQRTELKDVVALLPL